MRQQEFENQKWDAAADADAADAAGRTDRREDWNSYLDFERKIIPKKCKNLEVLQTSSSSTQLATHMIVKTPLFSM